MIRPTTLDDASAIISMVKNSEMFDSSDVEIIQGRLTNYFKEGCDDLWFTALEDEPVGVVYCASEPVTQGTWNVLMLLVDSRHQGKGYGKALIRHVESVLKDRGIRLLIIETSGVSEFEGAREFYTKCGYTQEAVIRDFYDDGDDKIVFVKFMKT